MKLPDQPVNLYRSGKISADEYGSLVVGQSLKPLEFYCPNGKQEEYIRTVGESCQRACDTLGQEGGTPVVLFTAANGLGKTTTSLHILLNIIYGKQNDWFDYEVYKRFPFPKLCWYVTTSSALNNVIIPELERLCPSGTYTMTKEGKQTVSKCVFTNGWKMNFFTTEQDPIQFESATVGLIVCDEPVPEPIWKALKSRRRMGCLTILPMTPLDCEPYIVDEVLSAAGNGNVYHLEGSVYEACNERGIRGHLPKGVIDEMVRDYDAEEIEARVYGRFMYFSERIWTTFKEELSIVEPSDYPVDFDRDIIFQVVDPHDGRPCANIWGALQKSQHKPTRVVIFAETPEDKSRPFWELKKFMKLEDEVGVWYCIERETGMKVAKRVIDKRFGFQTRGGTNIASILSNAWSNIWRRQVYLKSYANESEMSEMAYGHQIVRKWFMERDDGMSGILVWNTCYHTINGIKHYVRQRPRTQVQMNKTVEEHKIIEKYKDFNDCLRYLMVEVDNTNKILDNKVKRGKVKTVRKYVNDPLLAV